MGKERKGFGAKVAEFLNYLPKLSNLPRLILPRPTAFGGKPSRIAGLYCTEISLNTGGGVEGDGEELNIKLITQDQVNIDGRIRK